MPRVSPGTAEGVSYRSAVALLGLGLNEAEVIQLTETLPASPGTVRPCRLGRCVARVPGDRGCDACSRGACGLRAPEMGVLGAPRWTSQRRSSKVIRRMG